MRFLAILVLASIFATPVHAQEILVDAVVFLKAEVIEVISEEEREVPGTSVSAVHQILSARILEGEMQGRVVTLKNDYTPLQVGSVFYLRHITSALDGQETYSMGEPYRLPTLFALGALFLACLFVFGGIQGFRGLLALGVSLFFISYLLLPGILAGYPPLLVAVGVSSAIVILGSYVTHGFNRTTSAAVAGMLATIAVTGALAYWSVHAAALSGFTSEEVMYLNFDTGGTIDLVGLLLGGIIIGLLGVLYDAAIGQAVAVEELFRAGGASRMHVYTRALRIGREHVGALVNTLAIAYVGAALPLMLLLTHSYSQSLSVTLNQELFAAEIIRMLVGSIGIILAVPVTTLVAVWMLQGRVSNHPSGGDTHLHQH